MGGTRNRGSFVVNEASAVLTKRRESAVFRPQDQRSRAAAAVGSGGLRRSACTPFYPQRCGHPLWGQRMRGRLAIFRSALVGGLAAAVVLPHRVPIYGGIYGTAGRTTAASISHQPPSDRQSAFSASIGPRAGVPNQTALAPARPGDWPQPSSETSRIARCSRFGNLDLIDTAQPDTSAK